MTEKKDYDLICEYLNGNTESFGKLYDKYSSQLFRFIRGFTGESNAEDILHDVFIQVSEALNKYEDKGKFKSWIFTIARSRSLDFLRKKKRQKAKSISSDESTLIDKNITKPEEIESRKEMKQIIDAAINKLPETQREIFIMRQDAELSFKEISNILNIPINTALSHMYRATDTLRQNLKSLETYTD